MNGTLNANEFHPAASSAMVYIRSLSIEEKMKWLESFSSEAIEGNRMAEVCGETLHRIMTAQPVSDRYLLGLAWTLKQIEMVKP